MNSTVSPLAKGPHEGAPVVFSGDGRVYFGMVFKGGFLQLLTLGFYRFWLITNTRRLLWSSTQVGGDALEYTGRAKELLIGFLFALAILGPIYLIYFLIGIEAERYQAFASAPFFLILFFFGQFAIYRARRYRLTRTTWRGARFWMKGSGWNYAFRSFAWTALTLASLGLANPWRAAALERYKMRNSFYGDLPGRFEATGWALFKAGIAFWLIGALALLAPFVFGFGLLLYSAVQNIDAPTQFGVTLGLYLHDHKYVVVLLALAPTVALLMWPIYQALEWRWWLSGIRFGEVSFTSALPRSKILVLYLLYLGNVLALSLVLGLLFLGVATISSLVLQFSSGSLIALALGALGYLIMLVCFGALYRYFIQYRLWSAVAQTLQVQNLGAAAGVAAQGGPATALGEGLADGLGVAGF